MYSFKIATYPEFEYIGAKNEGTIFYDGTLRVLLNELKHVFQFESGKLEFIEVGGSSKPGLTYDIFDELATYKRQYAFDGILKLKISLSENDILNSIKKINTGNQNFGTVEIKRMKDIKVDIIAKVSDSFALNSLYENISQKELDVNSSAKDVFNANKENRWDRILNISLGSADKKKPIIYAKY